MAEKKTAGTTRKPTKRAGGVSAAEKKRRAAQAKEAIGTATLPTGESVEELRAAIEKARKDQESGRTLGTAEASGAKVTSIAELRARAMGELLTMPSGLVARVRRPGMIALLQAGVIPNSLMPLVEKGLEAAAKGQDVTRAEIVSQIDSSMMTEMMELFDLVAMFVVVEPKLRPTPQDEDGNSLPMHEWPTVAEDGVTELAYIEWVGFEDKQFIWNYAVGGTRDVDRFRADQETASVEPV
jgi:hypothetical protein